MLTVTDSILLIGLTMWIAGTIGVSSSRWDSGNAPEMSSMLFLVLSPGLIPTGLLAVAGALGYKVFA